MRIVGTSSNGGSQESAFYSNNNRGGKTWIWGRHGSLHGGHHQHECQPHRGGRGNFRERGNHGSCGGSHQGQQPNNDSNFNCCRKHWHMANNYYQRDMVTTKAICFEQIVWIWDEGL